MKKSKILLALFASTLLSGCTRLGSIFTNNKVEVQAITTSESVVRATTSDSYMLQYKIYPTNATDKSITVDTTYLNGVAEVTVDDYYSVFVWGKIEGTGVLTLATSNGKHVSYSITVIDTEPGPAPDPGISTVDRIANYFNEQAEAEDIKVYYYAGDKRWFGSKDFGHCVDDSKETLGSATYFVKSFLPDYLFRYDETYGEDVASGRLQHSLLMVNSNISAAVEIVSYIENESLITEIVMESMW